MATKKIKNPFKVIGKKILKNINVGWKKELPLSSQKAGKESSNESRDPTHNNILSVSYSKDNNRNIDSKSNPYKQRPLPPLPRTKENLFITQEKRSLAGTQEDNTAVDIDGYLLPEKPYGTKENEYAEIDSKEDNIYLKNIDGEICYQIDGNIYSHADNINSHVDNIDSHEDEHIYSKIEDENEYIELLDSHEDENEYIELSGDSDLNSKHNVENYNIATKIIEQNMNLRLNHAKDNSDIKTKESVHSVDSFVDKIRNEKNNKQNNEKSI